MFKYLFAAAVILAVQSSTAHAITVTSGDTIRGSYTFPTFGATELEPTSYLLRLASADLFGGGDAVGIRILDESFNPLLFTTFNANGSALDPTIGIQVSLSDFLPGVLGPGDPARVPRSGFVDITGLAGSFDVSSLSLFGTEHIGNVGVLRQVRVVEFDAVTTPTTPVPLPAAGFLLAGSVAGLLGFRFARTGKNTRSAAMTAA
ncbi:hypothetical protein [uncultured Roseibium sp.]|uniref:hypothetical protein n=1 Tax=uncultured Roseibium sp. TaxID=1936171 RepID=UPI00260C6931|nr:hypothetical protein [uncultured Roseibium sp.]